MVAVLVEAFGRATPVVVLSCRRRVPGCEVPQQRPRAAVQPARLPRAVQMLAAVEVAVPPPHQAIQHVARAVAVGMEVRLRPQRALVTQVQDLLQDDPRPMSGRPLPEPTEPWTEAPTVGRVIRLPDPARDHRKDFIQENGQNQDLEPRVQEEQQEDSQREHRLPGG